MPPRMVAINDLPSLAGQELGVSEWHEVTQEEIQAFAETTHDLQWIHLDPERAKQTPFGGTIAHGFYTLSLMSMFFDQIMAVEGASMGVNYGLNKVRFPGPVPVGKRIRGRAAAVSVDEVAGGYQLVINMTVEVEGAERPGCAAEWVIRSYK